jgi:putative DNA primase/helicase
MGQDQSFSEQVASKLIEQIKAGAAPWQRPYEAGMGIMPFNPVTGTRYKGINLVTLMAQECGDPRWMTYKQAKEEGYQVRRGERATVIQYWRFEERTQRKDEQGKAVRDQAGNPVYESRRLERPQVFLAYVFNAKQIDGIPAVERKVHNWDPVEEAERILQNSYAKIFHDGSTPQYRSWSDSIHLPLRNAFPSAANYYATALHELGHWTGHETRLNRDLLNKFGSEAYAREELRAEIASMIMGADLGLAYDPNQHASYTAHWVKTLENDSLEIFRAAADAEKIHKYLLSLQQRQSLCAEKPDDDKQAIIEEYDRLVDGSESRQRLEAERPGLVAARDQAVTELRREKLQKEIVRNGDRAREHRYGPL